MTTASTHLRQSASPHLGLLLAVALFGLAIALGYAVAVGEAAAFSIALAVVAALAVLFDFRIGAMLLILMLPLNATELAPHSVLGIPLFNPFNVVLAATLAAYLLRGGSLRQIAPQALLWLMVVPIVVAGVMGLQHYDEIAPHFLEDVETTVATRFSYLSLFVAKPLVMIAVALIAGAATAQSQKPESILVPIIVSVWIIALIVVIYVLSSGVRLGYLASAGAREFFGDLGLHANALGRLFAVAYALLLFVWWETKDGQLKAALFVTLGVACLAMVLTFSRGAFFGFFVVNALFLIWKFNARTIGLALLAGALCIALAPEYLWDRITYGFDSGDANTVSAGRVEGIWLPLLPELWKSPLWGQGLGATMWSAPQLTGGMLPVGHPHNAYLEALLDTGVIGLVLMLGFFLHVWNRLRALGSNPYLSPEMRAFFQGTVAALLCFLVTGWSGSSFRPQPEFGYLWLAIGIMYGMLYRTRVQNS